MRGLAVGALALVLLAGCGGGKKAAAPDEPGPSTTIAAVACAPATPIPAGATDTVSGPGDFDGDGRPDRVITYRVASAGTWHVRAELGAGGATEVELPAAATGVKALGGARLDVGPSEAALAVVGTNAAGVNIGLFVVRSCKMERVTVGGTPAEFPVRASVGARAGLACQAAGLVTYSATSTDGQTYQASTVSYLLLGTLLDEVHRNLSPLGATDPALVQYGAFSCGTLKL